MEYKIQEETLTAIADAIRQKASTQTQYTPVEMPGAIENIPTGGEESSFTNKVFAISNGILSGDIGIAVQIE